MVLASATHLYFDHPFEPDPEERGYYWATRFTDLQKSFSYNAQDIYANIDTDRMGNVLPREDICGVADENCPPLVNRKQILGIFDIL